MWTAFPSPLAVLPWCWCLWVFIMSSSKCSNSQHRVLKKSEHANNTTVQSLPCIVYKAAHGGILVWIASCFIAYTQKPWIIGRLISFHMNVSSIMLTLIVVKASHLLIFYLHQHAHCTPSKIPLMIFLIQYFWYYHHEKQLETRPTKFNTF